MKRILAFLNKERFKKEWDEKEYSDWKARRQLGNFRYATAFGLIEFGSGLFLGLTASFLFIDFLYGKQTTSNLLLAVNILICLVTGFFQGLYQWRANEKSFKEYEANHHPSAPAMETLSAEPE